MPPQRPKKSRLRSIALTILLPLGAVLLGMFGMLAFLILRISLSPNVKPGDRDYPRVNANPCEAMSRPSMRYVAVKTVEQQDIQAVIGRSRPKQVTHGGGSLKFLRCGCSGVIHVA